MKKVFAVMFLCVVAVSNIFAATIPPFDEVQKQIEKARRAAVQAEQDKFDRAQALLDLAQEKSDVVLAEQALQAGADVEWPRLVGSAAFTRLHEEASFGKLEFVKLLVKYGANIDAQSNAGDTPLIMAVEGGYYEVVEFLLASGARTDLKRHVGTNASAKANGETALDVAQELGYENIVQLILQYQNK